MPRKTHACWFVATTLLALLALSTRANAQNVGSSYYGLSAGTALVSDNEIGDHDLDFDPGLIVAGLAGYIFGSVRTEGEVSYSKSKLRFGSEDEDLAVLRGATGLYLDFIGFDSSTILPYIGGGLGFALLNFSGEIDDSDFALTAHGEFGVSFAAASSVDVIFSYRFEYFDTDIGSVRDDIMLHQIRAGLRFF